jgi:hypothetical protein
LIKEYLIYAAIMAVVLALLFRDQGVAPLLLGLIGAGPIYLLLGAVLAKFGYQRRTLAEMRTPRADPRPSPAASSGPTRARPAPTRRTSSGPSQRRRKR